jgi:endonuclease/exonuclease/phosphatase family metal-dependent hydrolase
MLNHFFNRTPNDVYNDDQSPLPYYGVPDTEENFQNILATKVQNKPGIYSYNKTVTEKWSEALVDSIRIDGYRVLSCSKFLDDYGIPGFQQLAIISKIPATYTCAKKWATFATIDPPRGFAAAIIQYEGRSILLCNVHLKSNLVNDDIYERGVQINILKRELAIQQLVRFISHDSEIVKRDVSSAIVAGDFNSNTDNPLFVSERTFALLDSSGFTNCFSGINAKSRITHPGKDDYPSATFDYIFVRGMHYIEKAKILTNNISDHYVVFCMLEYNKD